MIKMTQDDVKMLKELLLAKSEIYAQMKEMHHYAENFAVGIWQEQKKLEEKYNVDFGGGKHKLNLMTDEIEEVEEKKIIT